MKKIISKIFVFFLLISFSTPVYASESNETFIFSGYTPEGYYYEVYGNSINESSIARATISVERSIVFDGKVTPPNEIKWSEESNGITYTGTLYLSSYIYFQNETTAYYKGNLSSN